MSFIDIIEKKKAGIELSENEISYFVKGFGAGTIPDYQASAFLMAIYFQKMTMQETVWLTQAMVHSGTQVDLRSIKGVISDKHSTGGVGDKTTIALAPMVAAAGLPVAKMSGRGLGHTGGTLDKLEAIPGFRVSLSKEEFIANVNEIGIAIAGQTEQVAPADKKLYALRDVTGTVDNISLIASSVMSKKIASGAHAILLDVKTGSGAFMKTLHESFSLAKAMVDIGNSLGRETIAVISDMDQPLGRTIGNALEVREAIETLQGKGPEDFTSLCICLGAYMLLLGKKEDCFERAQEKMQRVIEDGSALIKMRQWIERQGGDSRVLEDPSLLKTSPGNCPILAQENGFIKSIDAHKIGKAALATGAGRETKESVIDPGAGILLHKKAGQEVRKGESIAHLYYGEGADSKEAQALVQSAFSYAKESPGVQKLIFGKVTKDEIERL